MNFKFKYLITTSDFTEQREGEVAMTLTLEEAKCVGREMGNRWPDEIIEIWVNNECGNLELILEGFVPVPEFGWHEA